MLLLITGGSASGKSALAEQAAAALTAGRVAYVATMQALDAESRARVARHREMRGGRGFDTLESPLALPEPAALAPYDTLLLECVSNLLANRIYGCGQTPEAAARYVSESIADAAGWLPNMVVVTNEVFSDGGRYDPDTAAYIEALGQVNRGLARRADAVVEAVCGISVFIKGKGRITL